MERRMNEPEALDDRPIHVTRHPRLVAQAMDTVRPLLDPPGTARDLIVAWKAAAELLATIEELIARRQVGAVLAICEREQMPCPHGLAGPGPECVGYVLRRECRTIDRVEQRWRELGLVTGSGRRARFSPVPEGELSASDNRWNRSATREETRALLNMLEQVCRELHMELAEA